MSKIRKQCDKLDKEVTKAQARLADMLARPGPKFQIGESVRIRTSGYTAKIEVMEWQDGWLYRMVTGNWWPEENLELYQRRLIDELDKEVNTWKPSEEREDSRN